MPWKPRPIPTVSPIAAHRLNTSGRNQPMQMLCLNGTNSEEYFVKLWNNLTLKEHNLAREVYGSLLADFFNIATPEIAYVDIPADFYQHETDSKMRTFLQNSPGLNFGSMNINGSIIFNPPAQTNILPVATRVFCFDMLIYNTDRCLPRVNMFKTAEGLVVYDHEEAFGFSRPKLYVGGFPPGWESIREPWVKDHVLYSSLKGRSLGPQIDEFVADLARLKDPIFATIEALIPPQWQADLENISSYIANTRDHLKEFKRNLQELLA